MVTLRLRYQSIFDWVMSEKYTPSSGVDASVFNAPEIGVLSSSSCSSSWALHTFMCPWLTDVANALRNAFASEE
ncbi:hypothetical protein GFD21_04960 [Bifidobacterium sp. SMA15]|uniref:Uncharacterized protein n=1 Tax=Bifidobacterium platyrrhinorum TaxID=2661628 RepID=A0A6L9SRI7_9BIFI|nr:hypothetical protein [Bifidobacterium platyrrhinorum]